MWTDGDSFTVDRDFLFETGGQKKGKKSLVSKIPALVGVDKA